MPTQTRFERAPSSAPRRFHTWLGDKLTNPYSFYKDENTINTVSRELEVIFIRAAESCAVITSR